MKIIFLENFIACFKAEYKNNNIFKQLVEFHKTQKKNDVSSEEQEISFNEFEPFLKNNTKSFNPLFSFLQQWQSPNSISLFLEQWRNQDIQQNISWNENNELLSLPNDTFFQHILPELDIRSQSNFFQVCHKAHQIPRPGKVVAQNYKLEIVGSLTYTFCVYTSNNTLAILARDDKFNAHFVIYDLYSGKYKSAPLKMMHPNLSEKISPLYSYNNRIFINSRKFLSEIILKNDCLTIKKVNLDGVCIGMVQKENDIFAQLVESDKILLSTIDAKKDLSLKTLTNFPGYFSYENEFVSDFNFEEKAQQHLNKFLKNNTLNKENDSPVTSFSDLIYCRSYKKYTYYTGKGNIYIMEQISYKNNKATPLFDVLDLRNNDKQMVDVVKFLRLDLSHCIYLTSKNEVFITKDGGKQVSKVDMDLVMDVSISKAREFAFLTRSGITCIPVAALLNQTFPEENKNNCNNDNSMPKLRRN